MIIIKDENEKNNRGILTNWEKEGYNITKLGGRIHKEFERTFFVRCYCSMEKPIIRLRPHHALCLRHYVGKGYNDAFVENMNEIHARLSSGEREMVQIILHRDSLCCNCPKEHDAACEREAWVQKIDREIVRVCGLRSGLWISWQELCEIMDQHIFQTDVWGKLCEGCEWYDLCHK